MSHRILVVDDDEFELSVTKDYLVSKGFAVDAAQTSDEALKFVRENGPEYAVALVDYNMPKDRLGGAKLVEAIRAAHKELAIYVYSGDQTRDSLKKTWAAGAYGFIEKGMDDELLSTLQRQCQKFDETTRVLSLNPSGDDKNQKILADFGFVGCSEAMVEVVESANRYKDKMDSVLIQGESGTGKETIARGLHGRSGPFVAVNCASFKAGTLADSELFGYEKGAFTGADKLKKGLFESADGGTLFLDEIHELNDATQSLLLRALQAKAIRRVGGNTEIPVDVRIVAATKPDIAKWAKEKKFLPDLYYRIKVLELVVPSLSERMEDIPLLISHFTKEYNAENKTSKTFRMKTVRLMEVYKWEGNVRELRSAVRELLTNCEGQYVEASQLNPSFFPKTTTWKDFEKKQFEERKSFLARSLASSEVKARVAAQLEISGSTLHSLLKTHQLYSKDS